MNYGIALAMSKGFLSRTPPEVAAGGEQAKQATAAHDDAGRDGEHRRRHLGEASSGRTAQTRSGSADTGA